MVDNAGEKARQERTQKIISCLSTKHVFWLMIILPRHAICKSYLPQGGVCLDLLYDLIHSFKAPGLVSLLLKHLDVIPDDFDQIISKLKGAFLTNDAAQNKELLELTTHERLKTAWI